MASSRGGVLLVLEVAALLGEGDEVGEDHPSDADVEEGLDGACLDVLLDVAIHRFIRRLLDVGPRESRLQMRWELADLQSLDLVVERPHRHWRVEDRD